MLFHTLQFILFFGVLLAGNFLLANVFKLAEARKWLLLAASMFFYMSWNVPLLGLMLLCITVNYVGGLRVREGMPHRKRWLQAVVFVNLGILGLFKYLDFGVQTAAELARAVGFQVNPGTFDLILPLGISFYTFQAMGYTIDVYRSKYGPYASFKDYALFVSFFPQLVAGPIVRADYFLASLRVADNPVRLRLFSNGLLLFVGGVFKKAVLADNSANMANLVFAEPHSVGALMTLLGVLAFSAQIYFDFSGYTDMARGLGKMLGIELPQNFARPYAAQGIRDFWRRWHISLSTWLRDYLYISLGGSRMGRWRTYRNLFLTMLLGGLWHGASMNFVVWGALHGGLLVFEHGLRERGLGRLVDARRLPHKLLVGAVTYALVVLAWIFFRASDFDTASAVIGNLFRVNEYSNVAELGLFKPQNWLFGMLLPYFYIWGPERWGDLDDTSGWSPWLRAMLFCGLLFLILLVAGASNEFIYFQF